MPLARRRLTATQHERLLRSGESPIVVRHSRLGFLCFRFLYAPPFHRFLSLKKNCLVRLMFAPVFVQRLSCRTYTLIHST